MLNQCNFIGRLGKDPEVRYTAGGDPVCNFSLACGEKYKDKNGNSQEKTEWVSIVIWGKLAEIAGTYLKKGSLAYISGKFATRKWADKNGNDRYSSEIVAREMKMLDGAGKQSEDIPNPPSLPPASDDKIPF